MKDDIKKIEELLTKKGLDTMLRFALEKKLAILKKNKEVLK